ncbi:MarR family winged helix-turn-helix transcriptional regulator [Saccharopolyspora phatthalungensis]|uniref:DNA-binding MarR family transcriptional regulator n=1 Tax=Saccharopolyspora phatthalungensis TaxID=664693 RepID=A0A840Q5X4_9PSEU|nr:MarR family transcriptional regulator [Saccharopolyspora phatthalungensis]MBB5154128.1 DNA-binding MarR family transcriptional regulator [Saccharopolyspora phatthalungensis]
MTEVTEQRTQWLDDCESASWRAYIVGSALLEYRLNRELQLAHGLSIADYEILVRLSEQPDQQMRMSELANEIAHSKSRISHQIRRLESAKLVRRDECPSDGRGVLAVLTEKGLAKLREAAPTHVEGVREHMIDLLTPEELKVLAGVFGRLTTHLRSLD